MSSETLAKGSCVSSSPTFGVCVQTPMFSQPWLPVNKGSLLLLDLLTWDVAKGTAWIRFILVTLALFILLISLLNERERKKFDLPSFSYWFDSANQFSSRNMRKIRNLTHNQSKSGVFYQRWYLITQENEILQLVHSIYRQDCFSLIKTHRMKREKTIFCNVGFFNRIEWRHLKRADACSLTLKRK